MSPTKPLPTRLKPAPQTLQITDVDRRALSLMIDSLRAALDAAERVATCLESQPSLITYAHTFATQAASEAAILRGRLSERYDLLRTHKEIPK